MTSVDWISLWRDVAASVAGHRAAGRGHLLTEDTVRLETVLALGEAGVEPGRLAIEVLTPVLVTGKLDLVVDPPDGVVVELKYPRDSRTGFSPDTMTLGELLRDLLRVAAVAAEDRWVVQVLSDRLVTYLIATLPATARDAIGAAAVPDLVRATLVLREPVGDRLSLFAYRVASITPEASAPPARATVTLARSEAPAPASEQLEVGTRDRAHREILAAARAVVARSGGGAFTMPEVIAEMNRRGTGYAERTIRTMISAHLCAEATGDGVAGYADLTRVGRGLYRLTEPGRH